eukprot:jgi/Chlat1/9288/Chrsp99S08547
MGLAVGLAIGLRRFKLAAAPDEYEYERLLQQIPSTSTSSSSTSSQASAARDLVRSLGHTIVDIDEVESVNGNDVYDWDGLDKDVADAFRPERAYLVGVECKSVSSAADATGFSIEDSLDELAQLAETAGLVVVGSTFQRLEHPSPKTYVGSGKLSEVRGAAQELKADVLVVDDELSPGQLRALERSLGENVRVCDRTTLILDIFNQRAATKEGKLQVALAQAEYQLPRLTRLWTHLERQSGRGLVKGMGEKQIEVDRRLLRKRMGVLKKEIEGVRSHRQQYRDRRSGKPVPVVSLVGYTNAGKSTLLNLLSGAGVLAEDKLFATLDPTTRRVELDDGKEVLLTDTVGFIQKLPTQLVAAFRATLEEIAEASLLLHVVDISHPLAAQQAAAVERVLADLDVSTIPSIIVWNKIDRVSDTASLRRLAHIRRDAVCISARTGAGIDELQLAISEKMRALLVRVEAVVPYSEGDVLDKIHRLGVVDHLEFGEKGTIVHADVPLALSRQLAPYRLH